MIKLILPYPVSGNRYWRHYKGRPVRSKEANTYRQEVVAKAHQAGVRHPLGGLLAVEYTLHPVAPKDSARRAKKDPNWDDGVRCIDLGNCEKVASDCLNGIVIEDDKQFRQIVLHRGAPVPGGALVVVISQWRAA